MGREKAIEEECVLCLLTLLGTDVVFAAYVMMGALNPAALPNWGCGFRSETIAAHVTE
jgi:hypothetical protein